MPKKLLLLHENNVSDKIDEMIFLFFILQG